MNPEMKACMEASHQRHVTCMHMAMNHRREMDGRRAEPQHMKIMMDCAQICAVAIDFMARTSEHHQHIAQARGGSLSAVARSAVLRQTPSHAS